MKAKLDYINQAMNESDEQGVYDAMTGGVSEAKNTVEQIIAFCKNNGTDLIGILDEIILACIEGAAIFRKTAAGLIFGRG